MPAASGADKVSVAESIEKPVIQPCPTAALIVAAGVILNSEPFAVRLLHLRGLLKRTTILVPSQDGVALCITGILGSVMLPVPPPKVSWYPD